MIDGYKKKLAIRSWPFKAVVLYQKHAQGVKRQRKRVEASTIQPDFRVLHRTGNILPGNALIGHSIAVRTKTSSDKFFLFRGDERGFGRPIHHVPVGAHRKNDGEDSLDDKDPSASWSGVTSQVLEANSTYLQPLRPATPLMCPIPHARIPPKAPAIEAAEKNKATRYWRSERLYHCETCVSL
jgi:hypothetical protein